MERLLPFPGRHTKRAAWRLAFSAATRQLCASEAGDTFLRLGLQLQGARLSRLELRAGLLGPSFRVAQAPKLLPSPGEMCSEVARFPLGRGWCGLGGERAPLGPSPPPGEIISLAEEGAPGWSATGGLGDEGRASVLGIDEDSSLEATAWIESLLSSVNGLVLQEIFVTFPERFLLNKYVSNLAGVRDSVSFLPP